MLAPSNLKHNVQIRYRNSNIVLTGNIPNFMDRSYKSIRIEFKFDPGAAASTIDYSFLYDYLQVTEDYVLSECERLGMRPNVFRSFSGQELVMHPLIIPEIVFGDYEVRNFRIYTLLDITNEHVKDSVMDCLSNVGNSVDILHNMSYARAYAGNSMDGVSTTGFQTISTVLGQSFLQHLNYDVRLEGLDIEPYEDDCQEFIFKNKGKFFFNTIDSSRRVFKTRYKKYMDGETDLFWMLSVGDMQEFDKVRRSRNNSGGVSALEW